MCDEPVEERGGGGGKEEKIRTVSRVLVEKKILAWNLMEDGKTHQGLPYTFLLNYISLCKGCHLSWTFYEPGIQASPFPISYRVELNGTFILSAIHLENDVWGFAFGLFKDIPHRTYPEHLDWMFLQYNGSQRVHPKPAASMPSRNSPEMWIFGAPCTSSTESWAPSVFPQALRVILMHVHRVLRTHTQMKGKQSSQTVLSVSCTRGLRSSSERGRRKQAPWRMGALSSKWEKPKNSIAQATPNTEHLEPCRVPGHGERDMIPALQDWTMGTEDL